MTVVRQHFWEGQCIHRECGIMSKRSLLDCQIFQQVMMNEEEEEENKTDNRKDESF